MNRNEVIDRLCKLKGEVWRQVVSASEPCDCVCHDRWEKQCVLARKYGDDPDELFRHGNTALEFIENAVREALKNYKPPFVAEDCDEGDA